MLFHLPVVLVVMATRAPDLTASLDTIEPFLRKAGMLSQRWGKGAEAHFASELMSSGDGGAREK